jgi:hypothetical protein
MNKKVFKVERKTMPADTKIDETFTFNGRTLHRVDNTLYDENFKYVSGIEGDGLSDEERKELRNEPIPEHLQGLFGFNIDITKADSKEIIDGKTYYRKRDALYNEDGKFVTGLSGNLLSDEELAELKAPSILKGRFGIK